MPRNPITYFKTNLMQNLNSSLNDSQNSVVYPIDVQRKVDEVFKRLQAPNNNVNINYNSGHLAAENNDLKKLVSKLSSANEAITNLRKLNKNNNSPKDIEKIREIGDKELKIIHDTISQTLKDQNSSGLSESSKVFFKQVEMNEEKNKQEQIKDIKENKSKDKILHMKRNKDVNIDRNKESLKDLDNFDYGKVISDLKNNNSILRKITDTQMSLIKDNNINLNEVNKLKLSMINNKESSDVSDKNKSEIEVKSIISKIKEMSDKIKEISIESKNHTNIDRTNSDSKSVPLILNKGIKANDTDFKRSISNNANKIKLFLKKLKLKKLEDKAKSKKLNENAATDGSSNMNKTLNNEKEHIKESYSQNPQNKINIIKENIYSDNISKFSVEKNGPVEI